MISIKLVQSLDLWSWMELEFLRRVQLLMERWSSCLVMEAIATSLFWSHPSKPAPRLEATIAMFFSQQSKRNPH